MEPNTEKHDYETKIRAAVPYLRRLPPIDEHPEANTQSVTLYLENSANFYHSNQ
jgi:hypothetical protein